MTKSVNLERIANLVEEATGTPPDSLNKIEKLGGLTNENYKVTINNKDYVARVPGIGTSEITDRQTEKINAATAYKIGITPKTIYFDEEGGFKITEYVDNAETIHPDTMKEVRNMELAADILNQLHTSNELFQTDFEPFDEFVFYEKTLIEAGGKLPANYHEVKRNFLKLKDDLFDLDMRKVPCHIDALAENFVKSNKRAGRKMYLVDWEESGNYDSLWDVTSVILECEFDQQEEDFFIRQYFGRRPTAKEKGRIEIHKITQDLLWSMWAMTKVAFGDTSLSQYAKDRYKNGKENLRAYYKEKAGTVNVKGEF